MPATTPEQEAIIHHDPGKHATVLAVAGSGKTTTMVNRIGWLTGEMHVPKNVIRAVMYNASAKTDFERKLRKEGIDGVAVQTFHAMGWSILQWAAKQRHAPARTLVTEAREMNALLGEAIREARDRGAIDPDTKIDRDEAAGAISTWKAMLTPPEQARHVDHPALEAVYAVFEELRAKAALVTFDDQIFDAVRLLESNERVRDRLTDHLDHLIIDEFQDVNLARMRLAKLLAGERARVMVVGDDDQCIYEWQGARSVYIKRRFQVEFPTFAHSTYKLTRSFRFGPAIAQVAANVIGHNTDRVEKDLVSADLALKGAVTLDTDALGGGNRQALPRLRTLLSAGARPADIVILVRKYSQSFGVQSQLLSARIPFAVDGDRPLHELLPVKIALAYLTLAAALDERLSEGVTASLRFVVNKPLRYVKKEAFDDLCRSALARRWTLRRLLTDHSQLREGGIARGGIDALSELAEHLNSAMTGLPPGVMIVSDSARERDVDAGVVLGQLRDRVNFRGLFEAYEGAAAVDDDLSLLAALQQLLSDARISPSGSEAFVSALDPRQGQPESACIKITTIFKAKGLEWDHVLLPDLIDGQVPDLRQSVNGCINVTDPSRVAEATATVESERRLFYVAATRARKTVHCFADPDDRRPLSRFVHEACIAATVDAVDALQALVRGEAPPAPHIARLAKASASDARLREGVLKMIRRASEDGMPEPRAAELSRALFAVNALRAAPFSYPHAYRDGPAQKPRGRGGGHDGLPF